MGKTATGILVLLFISTISTLSAQAFWCNGKLIDIGTTKSQVLAQCGEPDWAEEKITNMLQPYYYGRGKWFYVVAPVYVDEWIYNLGPQRFMRILEFRDNRLVDIELGGYGY